MSFSHRRSSIAYFWGLIVLLVAIWGAQAIALGRPTGSIKSELEQNQSDAQRSCAKNALFCYKDRPPAEAYEPTCTGQNKTECLLAWRNTRAAEAQAKAAYEQVKWAERGAYLLVVTFIATAFAAYFAYQAAHATHLAAVAAQASADIADETLKITERAYVTIEPRGINTQSTYDAVLGHINIRNAGRLPARNVRWFAQICISERRNKTDFEGYDLKGNHVLASGTEMVRGTNTIPLKEVQSAEGRGRYFYVWGLVEYSDGFGNECFTRFCHRYPCLRVDMSSRGYYIEIKDARFHEHGNDAEKPSYRKPVKAT